jgi:hypothetical protein
MPRKRLLEISKCIRGNVECRRLDIMGKFIKPVNKASDQVIPYAAAKGLTGPNTVAPWPAAHDAASP